MQARPPQIRQQQMQNRADPVLFKSPWQRLLMQSGSKLLADVPKSASKAADPRTAAERQAGKIHQANPDGDPATSNTAPLTTHPLRNDPTAVRMRTEQQLTSPPQT
ncbi:hypothetical protein ACLOJK_014600 [Asimina triloba]